VHTPEEDADCRFCEFSRACGARAAEQARAKLDNGDNAALEAYRRLDAHA
jgi:hypothetical protein